MPKNKFQDVIFTIIMATFMVYGMVVYNVALNTGGLCGATFLFKDPSVPVWLKTWAFNFPMALCWQLLICGPMVRFIFRSIFCREKSSEEHSMINGASGELSAE